MTFRPSRMKYASLSNKATIGRSREMAQLPFSIGSGEEKASTASSRSSSHISELPVELLLQIARLLPLVSKVCLALTCKSFFNLLDISATLLRSKELHHPRDLVKIGYRPLHRDALCTERWVLLRLLEDGRWRCCSGCLKLHPVGEFSEVDLLTSAGERTCMFGHLVGIVQVCPCIKMTFRDKLRLVSRLEAPGANGDIEKLNTFARGKAGWDMWHECSVHYGSVKVHAQVMSTLADDGELLVRTDYIVNCCHLGEKLSYLPLLCCAHKSIYVYVDELLRACLDPTASYITNSKLVTCEWCRTAISDFNFSFKQNWFSFRTTRTLGKGRSQADKTWHDQTVLSCVKDQWKWDPWKPEQLWLNHT